MGMDNRNIKIGDVVRVRIEKTVFGGDGLARPDGRVLFVPGTIPGEAAAVAITHAKRDFARGRVVELLEASPHRVRPACRFHGVCMGCVYGHISYEGECKLKNRQLREFLRPLSASAEVPGEFIAPEPELGYRNKIVLHTAKSGGDPRLGYVGDDNRSVTDIPECLLAHPSLNALLAELRADPGFFHSLHDRMELTLRHTEADGALCWRNRPGKDDPWLTEAVPGGVFAVPRGSFFQVNPAGMRALWQLVGEYLKSCNAAELLDVYCGSGFFACAALAAGVPAAAGVESDPEAVEAARHNVSTYGGDPGQIHEADAGEWLVEYLAERPVPPVVLVDPPRTGLTARARRAIVEAGVRRLIYVSCNPATLVRDAGDLVKGGFRLAQARMVNMFPRSAHFEIFTVLERG